ncbi:MAG TPA: helix-turn-helix domain-containing protein [Candidatus Saccharimonadales bacterium]
MTQIHTSRPSSHPLIDRVWMTKNTADGVYLATPDGAWDLIVMIQADGSRSLAIAGQATKPSHVPYAKDTGGVVVSFTPDAYLTQTPSETLRDSMEFLPNTDADHFEYQGRIFPFPTYDTAEDVVNEMIAEGLIASDELIRSLQDGVPKAASTRAFQRHFLKATGLTQKQFQQIKRAQEAVTLLKEGKKPIEAALDAGYSDQPHLAKSLGKIMESKPSNVDHIHKL